MRSTLLALAVAVLGITATLAAPLELRGSLRKGPETREEQINYLRRFGHWRGPQSNSRSTDEDLKRSLVAFQSFFELKATGEFDDDTKKLMATPRCGVPDHNEDSGRQKRYASLGSKWPITALTYRIKNYTPDLEPSTTKSVIIRAFKFWSDVTPLTFTESKTDDANISISFASRDHGDDAPFDGTFGVLAHAAPYPYAFAHFDEDETWTDNDLLGADLLWTATHEIGHVLGLDHSSVFPSVMYPEFIRSTINLNFALAKDDIEGIQSLYGKPLSAVKTPNKKLLPIPSGRRTTPNPPYAETPETTPSFEIETTPIPSYADTFAPIP